MDVLKIYEEHGALLKGHFLLSSGKHSDIYLQSELVMMHPTAAASAIEPIAAKLLAVALDFYTVASPAIGGIRMGYELARQMGKRAVFTERVDNFMQLRRGFGFSQGERVIIAEDVVTTGKSTKECIDAVTRAGAVVVGVVSLIDRSGGEASFGVPFISAASLKPNMWETASCPLCAEGKTAAVKPGSRKM